jgi:hypothetical protein
MTFKIGDRVRRTSHPYSNNSGFSIFPGDEATVSQVRAHDGSLILEGMLSGSCDDRYFELVSKAKAKVLGVEVDRKDTNPKQAVGETRIPLHLIPDGALAWVAMAFYEGATKYGAFNWRVAGVRASTYIAAARRHIMKWWNGEREDPKTRVHHLANTIAGLMILLDAEIQQMLEDDRPPKQKITDLFDELQGVQKFLTEAHANLNPKHATEKDQHAPR